MTPRPFIAAMMTAFLSGAGEAQDAAPAVTPGPQTLCVRNADAHDFLFAVDPREGARVLARLAPGGVLCAEAAGPGTGVVSVYESAEALEGCSRLVPVGRVEEMLRYVDFDRCAWTSNR